MAEDPRLAQTSHPAAGESGSSSADEQMTRARGESPAAPERAPIASSHTFDLPILIDPQLPSSPPSVEMPKILGGTELIKLVGRGGMGEVWLGRDVRLDRKVAVKLMRRELASEESIVARFQREARAVARFNHPNIVQIYQISEEQGLQFFTMEWVEGRPLDDILKQHGALPYETARHILAEVVDGLAYACAQGVIHRDIKPANLIVGSTGRVKIADFGLARFVESDIAMTTSGLPIGTPKYMSPEQAKGETADHRSDIYSLGITFYHMITGEPPHIANTPTGVLMKHLTEPLPEPIELKALANGKVMGMIQRMTAKRPGDRFQDYKELSAAIAGLAGAAPPSHRLVLSGATSQPSGDPLGSLWPSAGSLSSVFSPATPVQTQVPIARPPRVWTMPVALAVAVILGGTITWFIVSSLAESNAGRSSTQSTAVVQTPVPPAAESAQQNQSGGPPRPLARMLGLGQDGQGRRPPEFGGRGNGPPPAPPGPPGQAQYDPIGPFLRDSGRGNELREKLDEFQFEAVSAAIDQALSQNNVPIPARTKLGQISAASKQLPQFRATMEKYIAANPNIVRIHFQQGPGFSLFSGVLPNGAGFAITTPSGQKQNIPWSEIRPHHAREISEQIYPVDQRQKVVAAMDTLFPPPPSDQQRPGGP